MIVIAAVIVVVAEDVEEISRHQKTPSPCGRGLG
jgi:hypothetical protein